MPTMARCPFAAWRPISGSSGSHLGGPFKIVHHTTEGSTAEGAMRAYLEKRCDPHFTVDATKVYQHIDTEVSARALRNPPGGVETNRDSAIQIELVGFAHLPKDPRSLTNLARLCRWIEATHGVPRAWPAGLPRPARNGRDPGGHNRDPHIWDSQGGHYGHCHVPENTHWDPAYTRDEVDFLMAATFDDNGRLLSPARPAAPAGKRGGVRSLRAAESTMPDHGTVALGASAYIRDLVLPSSLPPAARASGKGVTRGKATAARAAASGSSAALKAAVDVGSLVSFVDGVSPTEKDDVLYGIQLAQRGASGEFDRFTQPRAWYGKYVEILENLGWAVDQFAFSTFDQAEGEFRMDQAALAIVAAIATQNQLAVLEQSIKALSKLKEDDGTIRLLDFHSSLEGSGNFQVGAVQRSENGALSMALGAFHFRSADERRRFLFFRWGSQQVNFWTAAQRMTLNADFFARQREGVVARLQEDAARYISEIKLGTR
jgi:hypothetical protein